MLGADRLDEALDMLDSLLEAARARGADYEVVPLLGFRADVLFRRGELARAELDARAALELAGEAWHTGIPAIASVLAAILLEHGSLEEAHEVLDQAGIVGPANALPATYFVTMGAHQRGRLRLAEGDAAGAAEDLLECGRRLLDAGEPNPAYIDWRSCAALALARLGDHDRARALVEEELTLARKFGAPRAIALALRARAALNDPEEGLDDLREAARDEGIARLEQSVAILEDSPARLEYARSLVELGAALRRRGLRRQAREALAGGMELAHQCGAARLVARADEELRATGARPRRVAQTGIDALTAQEQRVARLAAEGRSNAEVAQELFVSLKTIETHLSHAYSKLGLSGPGARRGLTEKLGQ